MRMVGALICLGVLVAGCGGVRTKRGQSGAKGRSRPVWSAVRPPAEPKLPYGKQPCPRCAYPISDIAGSRAAVCPNCGYKDPCC